MAAMSARISASTETPLMSLMSDPDLLTLVQAHGAALCYDGVVTTRGVDLDEATLHQVSKALEDPDSYVTATDSIARLVPALEGNADVAGVLRIGSSEDRWLLWLRPEQQRVVDWGGDPTNKLLAASEGPEVRLSPRKSFEKWRQVVQGRSTPWTSWQVEAADAIGKHLVGLLLIRSREQIAMAESLQRSVVLDRAPQFEGAAIAARYEPASAYQLGGDWWDAFRLADGRLAFAVGDVAGHGVSAASAMTQLRVALRAYVYEGHSPAECLDRLDRLMDGLLVQRVATAVVAIADPVTRRVQLASAGHPPPLLVAPGSAEELEVAARPLLGVGTGTASTTEIELEPGAAILLYTDGLVEQRGVDLGETLARLRDLARATYTVDGAPRPAADLDAWLEGLMAVQDGAGDDDTTLLAVRLGA
jgi:hypothetical protein